MLRQLVGLSAVLLTAAVGLWAGESSGPQVTGGTATFAQNGANWTVTTGSNRTVIRWNSFGVPQGSTTQFIQPGKGSAVLNKVTGSLPSEIAGALLSNGRVYLLNPNGILVGPSGVIRTAGFVASTLDVNEGEFLEAGTLHFAGGGEASVVNLGTIEASSGPVLLIAPRVENHGTIRAADGVAGLVAGRDVLLTADDQIYIQPSAETLGGTGIENTGTIEAARAELVAQGNLYGLAINNSGTVNATSVVEEGGRILLRADGGRIVNSGTLTARTLNADGKSTGGTIEVAGAEVILDGPARLDVSGDLGGGTIHVGGNYQGQGPLPNAQYVWVGSNVEINADALEVGDGGTAIFWSDLGTWFYGSLSAKGGASGGDGGFAEISGKAFLRMAGSVDLSATNGSLGTLLLDPTDIEIQNGTGDGDDTGNGAGAENVYSGTFPGGAPATSVIFESELEGLAANANVTIQATNSVILKDLTTDGVLELALASGSLTIDAGTSFTFEDTTNTIRTNGGDLIIQITGAGGTATLGVLDTTGSAGTATGGDISVSVGAGGSITLHQNLTTLDGNITLTGAVSLQTDLTLDTGDGNASITGALDGNANTLTVASGAGTVTFGSALSDLDTLDVTGGTISLGGNVTTTSTQDYHGDVEIAGASVTLTTTDSTVTFDGTIEGDTDGGQALTVSVGNGDIVLSGAVGATNALASLNLTSTSTTIEIGGDVTTAGAQVYDGHVLITGGDVTLTGVGIQFTGDVDGSGTENLTVDATTGTADFQGAVDLLNNFEASGAAILFAGDVTTDGTQTYTGAVELFGDRTFTASDAGITFDGAVSGDTAAENLTVDAGTGAVDFTGALTDLASLDATGTTIGVGDSVTTSGTQDYHGDVSVNGAATLSGTDLTFEGTVSGSGAEDLTVSGTGTVDFQDEVSALNSLDATGATIQLAADVSTTASQSYTGDVVLLGDVTLTAVGVTFSATVTGSATTENLVISSAGGTVEFGGEVSDLGSLDVSADDIEFAANVTTTNAQTYTGDVALNGDILFTTTDHDVTFDGAVTGGGNDLTVAAGAGDVIVTGAVSGVGTLDLTGATIELGGDVTTAGAQTYQGNVQINESLTLTGAGITFEGTVAGGDGDEDLTVDAGATTADFQDAVSNLASLDVTGAAIQLATDVTTTGLQSYDGAVTIFSSLTLTAGDVTFVSTVEGDTGAESLTIDATGGTVEFGSTADQLDVLDVTGATIRFAADVTTVGAQTFTGDVELTGSVLFTTSNDDVTFDGNVDGGTNDLTVDAGTAAVDITGNVTDVGTLDLTGATIDLGGDVTTSGSQTYHGNVLVNTSLTLTGAGILFEGTVSGGAGTEDLTVDATTGTADFQDTVSSLNNFDASGVDIFLAKDVTTTGTQDYDGSVRLYGDVILTGSGVTFTGIVEGDLGTENLTVDATGGTADFGGELSSLASLDVTATSILLGADVTTTGAQDYDGAVELQANVALTTTTAGDVTFTDTVDGSGAGGQNLTLDVAGAIDFQGAIGTSVRLGAIQVDDATDVSLLGLTAGSFTQVAGTGTTTFDGAVDLDAAGGLSVATATIAVNGTVDTTNGGGVTLTAAGALTIDAAGTMNLDGAFLENGAGTVNAAGSITTNNADVTFTNTVTLDGDLAVTSGGGEIEFLGGAVGSTDGGESLTLDAGAGGFDFGGDLGATGTALNDLTLTSDQLFTQGVDIVAAGTVLLQTAGVTQNAGFTVQADTLLLEGTGDFTLNQANDVSSFGTNGAGVNGDIVFNNGTTNLTTLAIDTTGTGNLTLRHDGTLDLMGAVSLTGSFLEEDVAGGGEGGLVTLAQDLSVGADQDITFRSALEISGDREISTSGAGNLNFFTIDGATADTDSITLTVDTGTITYTGGLGGGTRFDNITLNTGAGITIDQDLSAATQVTINAGGNIDHSDGTIGADTVLLATSAGGATQSGTASIDATTLLVEGTGDFTLNNANSVDEFGTNGAGVDGDIVFNNGTTNFTALQIDTTGTGNLTLRHDGTLDLAGAVTLTGSFEEADAAGTGEGGLVTLAQNLSVGADEDITFNSALEITGDVEISTSGAGNLNFLTIDGATADADSVTLTLGTGTLTLGGAVGGGTRLDNVAFNSGAGITLNQNVTAATQVDVSAAGTISQTAGTITADTVLLVTTAGGATQSGTASIDATTLLVEGTGSFTLNNANSVDEFGTNGAGVAGDIVFNNGTTNFTALQIDTTGTGNLTLRHDGTLDLSDTITLTGSFVEENAAGTGAGGLVTLSQDLSVAAGEDITFKSALAIDGTVEIATSGTGNLSFFTINGTTLNSDVLTLTLGTGTLTLGGAVGGTTAFDSVTFDSGAGLTLNQNVTAANQVDVSAAGTISQTAGTISADTVTLTTTAGGATQSGTASIDATTLLEEGTGSFTLNNANSVDEFGTNGAGVAGDIVFNNGTTNFTALQIDTTGTGNLTLRHDGTLDLSDAITLSGSFVEENAAGTGAGGLVTLSQDLSVAAGEDITFKSALEIDGAVEILTSGAGNLNFFTIDGATADADSITLTVDTGAITYSGAIGGGTRFDAITLNTGTGITLGQDLDAASLIEINAAGTISHTGGTLSAATVHLNTTAGGVSQAVGSGGIAATTLTLEGTGNFNLLDADNAVGTLETNGALAGNLTFVTGSTVTTGDITADAVAVEHTGALTLGGDITADSFVESNVGNTGGSAGGVNTLAGAERTIDTSGAGGAITFKSNATLNSDLTLNAGASGGTITLANVNDSVAGADTLDLTGGGFAFGTLGAPNRLGEIALTTNQAGGITVTGTGLNADRITFENTGGNLTVGSALTADEITLTANGVLAVNGLLTALDGGAGLVTLSGTGITQTAGIRTDTLELDGTGSVVLNSAANQIEALTALSNTLDDVQVTTNPASGTFTLGAFDTTGAAGTGDLTVNFGSDNLLINGPVDLKGSFSTGASTGGITLAGDLTVGNSITFTGTLGVSGVASLTSGAGGGITLGDVTGAGADLTLTAGSLGIDFNGNVGTSGGRLNSVTLDTDGPVTQDAGEKLHANTLTLLGDATYSLRTNILTLDGGGAALGGSLSLTNDGALAVDVNPLTVTGDVTLRTLAGAITINEDVSSTGAGGTVTLDAAGGATTAGGSTVSADNLLLSGGGTFDLATSVDTVASTNLGAGSVTLVNDQTLAVGDVGAGSGLTAGGGIDLTVTAGDLTLNRGLSAGTGDVSLDWAGTLAQNAGTIAGGTLTLAGDSNAGLALALNVSEIAGTVTGSSTLALNNTGALTFTGFDADTNSLRVNAAGANGDLSAADLLLTGTGTFNLDTTVGTLAANVTGALTIDETDGLIVGTVNGVNGVQTAGGNDISLTTGGALTLNQQVNAGAAGDVTLDFATLSGAALVTGNVLDLAGASGFTLATDVNVLQGTLTGAAATTVNSTGALNLNGFDASGISLRLSADGATGSVTSNELQLNGTGVFNLTTTVNTLAANVTGALSVDDTDGLTVGTVGAVTGVNSNGSAVTLGTNGAGVLALNQDVTAAGATVILDAAGGVTSGGGTVTAQTLDLRSGGAATVDANVTVLRGFSNGNLDLTNAGHLNLNNFNAAGVDFLLTAAGADGTVSAGGLAIFGTGAFALTSTLDRLAGNVNGAVTITDAGTLTIGTVGAQSGLISTGGDIRLTAPGGFSLAQDLRAAGFEIHLLGNGALQTGGTVEADRLRLAGPGAFTLTGATNDVNVLAAQTNSAFSFTDVDNLTIGAVGVTVGIDTSGNNLTLTTGDTLTLAQEVRVGMATTTFNVAAGGVNQIPGARIMSDRLLLTGAGAFNLLEGGNLIRTLAGNLTGGGASTLNLRTAGNLFIGTVGVQNGILTTGGSVTLAAPGGFIQVDRPINTGAGPPGTATLTGDIRPANPMLAGSGNITLTAQILPGGGAGNTTTFQLNPSIPMGPQDGGFTLPDLGNVNIGIDTFDDPDGLGTGGDLGTNGDDLQITLPEELLKAFNTVLSVTSTTGFEDEGLRNSLDEFQASEQALTLAQQVLDHAAKVLRSLQPGDPLREALQKLIDEVNAASQEVRNSNVALAELIAKLYAAGRPDRVGKDALEGALKGMQRANERLLVTSRALEAALKAIQKPAGAPAAAADRAVLEVAAQRAREQATREAADARDRQDRVGQDAKFATLEEYKAQEKGRKPEGPDGK